MVARDKGGGSDGRWVDVAMKGQKWGILVMMEFFCFDYNSIPVVIFYYSFAEC